MRKTILSTLMVFLFAATMLFGDEVTDTIDRAKSLYAGGKYSEAVSELKYAISKIREMQAEMLKAAFPASIPNFTAQEAEVNNVAMGFMGGGLSASRRYTNSAGAEVKIEIITESPLIQSLSMFLSNPMFAGQGKKMVRVGAYKGLLEFTPDNNSGKLQILVGNKTLLSVEGNQINSPDILTQVAEMVDKEKIKHIVGE